MMENVKLPVELWEHALFRDAASFVVPGSSFTPSHVEYRVRKIRNMPSCSDTARESATRNIQRVLDFGAKWLVTAESEISVACRAQLERLGRVRTALRSGSVSNDALDLMMKRVRSDAIGLVDGEAVGSADATHMLETLGLMLLDRGMRGEKTLEKRYLRRLYRAIDSSLDYNSTSDGIRNREVLMWIRGILERDNRRACSYVDVGCSMATNAANTDLAAEILRPSDLCRAIHGTDVVAPRAELASRMLKERGILLYRADPVSHPLPRRYDVMLLANVHRHLDRSLQERLLTNLCESLNENGILVVNWRFDSMKSLCLCVRRKDNRLEIAQEADVGTPRHDRQFAL